MESPDSLPRERRTFLPPHARILRLDFCQLGRPIRPRAIEDRAAGTVRIVRRLLAIVREPRASARRVGSPFDDTALRAVLYALRVESLGGDPQALLQDPDPVVAWLRQALYQDLLEEPSNVLFTTRIDNETVHYEAMEAAFWRDCLGELEVRLLTSP